MSRVRALVRRHSYSFFSSLGALLRHKAGSAMTVVVLGLALLLPLGLHLALQNLARLAPETAELGAVSVFLAVDVDATGAAAMAATTGERPDVAGVTPISPEAGLRQFQADTGFGGSLAALENNPLPWVVVVEPAATADVAALVAELEALPEVDLVRYDRKWLERLAALIALGRALASTLAVLFALAAVVVVANTIRLDVAARRDEIEVMTLVGATPGFVRLPFLYAGLWYGLAGGLLALLLLTLATAWLAAPLERLLQSYGAAFTPTTLRFTGVLGILAVSAALGWSGAWLAVTRYLRGLRPARAS